MVHSLEKLETLFALYRVAFKIRHVETEISRQYQSGEMRCPVHLSVGQELPSAIISLFQKRHDYAVSTHRAHAHFMAKGGDTFAMMAEIFGKSTGCSKGRGGSMHLSDPKVNFVGSSAIVGNSIPIGVGIAYGINIRKESSRSYVFLGDGATEEGVFYESVNFAVLHNLPVIFVCENNFYSVYTGLEPRQPKGRRIHEIVRAMGMSSVYIPFGDLDKALNSIQESLLQKVKGPLFIEIDTYRWLEHCGPNDDDHLDYRPEQEKENYLKYDVLEDLTQRVLQLDISAARELEKIRTEITNETSDAFDFARNSPFPSLEEVRGDFYEYR